MAILYVTEFADLATSQGQVGQVVKQPPLAQQVLTISASSAVTSTAFNTNTKFVRLHSDAICSVQFASSPSATTTMARMAANQTEYFQVPSGFSIGVIGNT